MKALVIFPHQIFDETAFLKGFDKIVLIEEELFFKQFPFHKAKLALHRASMKYYENQLRNILPQISVDYIDSSQPFSAIQKFIESSPAMEIHFWEVHDDWLQQRIEKASKEFNKSITFHQSPYFLNSESEIRTYFQGKKRFLQNDFYIEQRKKRNILMDGKEPVGGQWNFDKDNRLKYPKNKTAPKLATCNLEEERHYIEEAKSYIEANFSQNPGVLTETIPYPISRKGAQEWLVQFVKERLQEFGPYEDAIVAKESTLHHSILTPMLNIGLLTPQEIIDYTLQNAASIPLASLEGFIRQIIGWREFIRAIYLLKGRKERSLNYWQFNRKIPASFWTGTTGIAPIDETIQKVLQTGYCHHIERLMLLGNFMLLCEFDPDEVYHWFMSLFIDAYDWVMVPNVYGMSQFADGGIMATKPYISGSNYVLKMSDYGKGEWTIVWDALFWNFMHNQQKFFSSNPRLSMLLGTLNKMSAERKAEIFESSAAFLNGLK